MNGQARRKTGRAAILLGAACLALVLLPAGATVPDSRSSEVTAWFVETTPEALAQAEASLGFSLDPTHGRCVLSLDEQATLLGAVVGEERGRIVASGSVSLQPGSAREFKAVETVRVPVRYEARIDAGEPSGLARAVPAEFAEREVGLRLDVTSLEGAPAGALPMQVVLTASRVSGWRSISEGVSEPVIKTWELRTTLAAPLGKTMVLVNHPQGPFDSSAVFRTASPEPPTVLLILIRAE
jgi:hypothetical protein